MLLFSWQYSRNVSQTRWIIDDERMGEASVEVLFTTLLLQIAIVTLYSLFMPIVEGDNNV